MAFTDVALERARRARFSYESLGWRRATIETVTARRPYRPEEDRSFDDRHGTDTAGSVPPQHLGIADAGARGNAILYLPSPVRVTTWMLDRVEIDPASHTFVDLGCGKGRVLLLAAQRPFRQVIGIEISNDLSAIARQNLGRYRPAPLLAPVDVVTADAASIDLPETDLLLHLYHPFAPEVTATVLRRLETSLHHRPRRVTVAYLVYTAAVAPVRDAFADFPWLHQTRYEQSVRGHYNWMLYTN